jgi:hypothetical protein
LIPFLLSLLAASPVPAATSWLCQCFENDGARDGLMWVSRDAALSLAAAESGALETCRRAGNPPPAPGIARCIRHESAGTDSPPRETVKKTFETLSDAQRVFVKAAYAKILEAHERKDFSTMRDEAEKILSLVVDYNDTKSYLAIANRGLKR